MWPSTMSSSQTSEVVGWLVKNRLLWPQSFRFSRSFAFIISPWCCWSRDPTLKTTALRQRCILRFLLVLKSNFSLCMSTSQQHPRPNPVFLRSYPAAILENQFQSQGGKCGERPLLFTVMGRSSGLCSLFLAVWSPGHFPESLDSRTPPAIPPTLTSFMALAYSTGTSLSSKEREGCELSEWV